MAIVHITFRSAFDLGGSVIPNKSPRVSETITSSGTSQPTTITALQGEVLDLTSVGGAVFIAVGQAPVATDSGAGVDLIADGASRQYGPLAAGDKVAVIDAS